MSKPKVPIHKVEQLEQDTISYVDLPDVSELQPRVMHKAAALLGELAIVTERMKDDELLEKDIKKRLEVIQTEHGLPGLRHMAWCFVARQLAGRKTLDKLMLIENGVDPEVIEQSMKTGQPYVTRTFKELGSK